MANSAYCVLVDQHSNDLLALRRELAQRSLSIEVDAVATNGSWLGPAVTGAKPPDAIVLNWDTLVAHAEAISTDAAVRWPHARWLILVSETRGDPALAERLKKCPVPPKRCVFVNSLDSLVDELSRMAPISCRETPPPATDYPHHIDLLPFPAAIVSTLTLQITRFNARLASRLRRDTKDETPRVLLEELHTGPDLDVLTTALKSAVRRGLSSMVEVSLIGRSATSFVDAWITPIEGTLAASVIYVDATPRKSSESKWRKLAETVSNAASGTSYFQCLVTGLVQVLNADVAAVLRVSPEHPDKATILSAFIVDRLRESGEIPVTGHPIERTLKHHFVCVTHDFRRAFPEAKGLHALQIESYMGMPLHDQDGRVFGVLEVMHRHRTERTRDLRAVMKICAVRAEAELAALAASEAREAEHRRTALAVGAGGLATWDWNIRSGQLAMSERWAQLLGLKECTQSSQIDFWRERIHPDDRTRAAFLFLASDAAFPEHSEAWMRLRHSSGSWIWVFARGAVTERAPDGSALRLSGTLLEATSLKEAELALTRSHALLAHSERIAHIGSWSWDLDTDQVIVSSGTARIFGLDPGTHVHRGQYLRSLVHPEDRPAVDLAISTTLAQGSSRAVEFRIVRSDGSECHIISDADVEGSTGSERRRMRGVVHDVTHRVQIERERLEQLTFARVLCDSVPPMIAYIDTEERYRFVNRRYCDRFMRDAKELEGRRIEDVVGPEVYARLAPYIRRGLQGERVEFDYVASAPGQPNELLHAIYIPHVSTDGVVRGGTAFIQDITREHEFRLRVRAMEELTDVAYAVIAIDPERVIYASQAYTRIWGRPIQELLERHRAWLDGIVAEDRERVRKAVEDYSPDPDSLFSICFRVARPDGTTRHVRAVSRPICDLHGRPREMCVVAHDVTHASEPASAQG